MSKSNDSKGALIMENNPPLSERGRIAYQQGYEKGSAAGKDDALRFVEELLPLSKEARRERIREVKREQARLARELAEADLRSGKWRLVLEIYQGLLPWFKEMDETGFAFGRPESPSLHHLIEDLRRGHVVSLFERHNAITSYEEFSDTLATSELFCIEHDWAAAFKTAQDFDGPFRLPYDNCCFEFRLNGRKVIVLGANYSEPSDSENIVILQAFYKSDIGWVADGARWHGGGVDDGAASAPPNAHLACLAQIKAVCVALDAQVAEATQIRAVPSLVKARVKNRKAPPKDYHVVSLAHRHRAERLPSTGEPKRHVRLHFRRGHWRHFTTHRTWIKWMLVGDPDLGFVDKHYRL